MTTVTAIKPSLGKLVEKFTTMYIEGKFVEGVCEWNGDDALMSPMSFGKRFGDYCHRLGYDASEYEGHMNELIDWCNDHLKHLESKFI